MRIASFLILAFATTAAPACKSIECGTGTIERDGTCAPSDETVGTAKCGPFTMIQGDQCVPIYPPAICDPEYDGFYVVTIAVDGKASLVRSRYGAPSPVSTCAGTK